MFDSDNTKLFLLTNNNDHFLAKDYSIKSLDYTFDRMNKSKKRRQENIYIGKLVEAPICRELNSVYGLIVNTTDVTTSYMNIDKGDISLSSPGGESYICDIKGLHNRKVNISNKNIVSKDIAQKAFALVPVDQFKNNPKDIYIFTNIAFYPKLCTETNIEYADGPALLTYPRWETKERIYHWTVYPPGTLIYPYLSGHGTRIFNKGCAFSLLRPLKHLKNYLEVQMDYVEYIYI